MEGGELPPKSAKKAEDAKPAADGDAKAPDGAPEKGEDLPPPLPENRVIFIIFSVFEVNFFENKLTMVENPAYHITNARHTQQMNGTSAFSACLI